MSTFAEAESVYLYDGGIQAEQPVECYRCGNDIGDDAVEIDGEQYCGQCVKMITRAYGRDLRRRLESYTRESDPFKCYCIKLALEEYADEFEE